MIQWMDGYHPCGGIEEYLERKILKRVTFIKSRSAAARIETFSL